MTDNIIDFNYARRAQEAAAAKDYFVRQIRKTGGTEELKDCATVCELVRGSCDLAKDKGQESALRGLQQLEAIAGRKDLVREAINAFKEGLPAKYLPPEDKHE